MKKIITILLTLTVALTLTACDNTSKKNNDSTNNISNIESTDTNTTEKTQSSTIRKITEAAIRNHAITNSSDFSYSLSTKYDGIRIDTYKGNDKIVVIPEEIDGYTVVEIAKYTFANDSIVQGVLIPKTVKQIKELFINNANIEVVIAEGLDTVGYGAFTNCRSLREVILGKNVISIGELAFSTCPSLEKITIPATVETMTEYEKANAFFACPKLTIYGESGSFIEGVAQELGIPFVTE